jgi:hypothetical protein
MAVTITDVAQRAGVSRSTVSYVLSGSRPISPETRRRVEQAIEELQFRPHAGARSIRSGRNGVIAMALPMVHGAHNQVQMPYVWAALTAAQDLGFKMLMLTDDDGESAIRDSVTGSQVDGVMLMEVQRNDPRVPLLSSLKCPAILVCAPSTCSSSGTAASGTWVSHLPLFSETSPTPCTPGTGHWPPCARRGPAGRGRRATGSRATWRAPWTFSWPRSGALAA